MARLENDSARKSSPWLDKYDLDTFKSVDAFMKELLKQTWTGKLGTRQSADCLAILRLLLERRLWLPSGSGHYNPETGRYNTPNPEKGEEDSEEANSTETNSDSPIEDLPKMNLSSPEQCEKMMQYVTGLQAEGRLQPKQAQVIIQAINNALEALKLQGKAVDETSID
jgi:hypothetical protein